MPSASEHAERVLSAILPNRDDLLNIAQQKLTYEVFTDQIHLNLFKLIERYNDVTNGVLQRNALEDMLAGNTNPGRAELYLETYDLFASTEVADTDFYWSLEQLKELAAERATKEVVADAMEILTSGKEVGRGQTLQGHEEARNYALERFSLIDRDLSAMEAPEGDMRRERAEILADYAERKKRRLEGKQEGIKFGITELDNLTGGVQRGELALVAAYTSDGKTSLCVQMAWHAAVKQGKNVVFFSTETTRDVVRRKIVSRHSMEPQFGLPDGLNARDLKDGTLNDVQEVRLQEVVHDLDTNPTYGKIYIVQVPREANIATLEHRMYRLQRQFDIDLVIVDYLAQFRSVERIDSYRERLTDVLKEAKRLGVAFNNGRGVAMVSPWQINREWYERAQHEGRYSKSSLAETSEAERTPDLLIMLLGQVDNTDRNREVKGQVVKNRDGETSNSLRIEVDYATSTFKSMSGGMLANAASRSSTPTGGLASLID